MDIEDWLGDGDDGDGEGDDLYGMTVRTSRTAWELVETAVARELTTIFARRPTGTVTYWAEVGGPAIIPAGNGQPKPGKYRSENGPVMVEVMNAFSDPEVSEITMMIGAQVGKSRAIQNMLGWIIDWNPGPVTIVYPNEDMAQVKMEEDFLPSIWATPAISHKVAPDEKPGQRDKGRKFRFTMPGGWIRFVSAKSPPQVKGSPAKYVFIEEHAESAEGAAGDIDGLIMPRTTQYANWKVVRLSTPKGSAKTCATTAKYEISDKSKPFVKCPKCELEQIMEWENVRFGKDSLNRTRALGSVYVCSNSACAYPMDDAVRGAMIDKVRWKQTALHECCGEEWDPMEKRNWNADGIHQCPSCDGLRTKEHRGFWASTLYAKGVELHKLVARFLEAKTPKALMEFINQTLAKNFEPAGDFDRDIIKTIMDRRLDYQALWGQGVRVPPGARFVEMAIDIQRNRVHWEKRGYGNGEESWGVDYGIIMLKTADGNPGADVMDADAWERLWKEVDEIRRRPEPGVVENGERRLYPTTKTWIDIGDGVTLKPAMKYIRANLKHGVQPIRGERTAPLFDAYDPLRHKHSIPHHQIGTDAAKELLYQRLHIVYAANEDPRTTVKPGMMHWPRNVEESVIDPETGEERKVCLWPTGYTDQYFEEVTNFKQDFVRNRKTGQEDLRFGKAEKTVREEALDIINYLNGGVHGIMRDFRVSYIEHVPEQWRTEREVKRLLEMDGGTKADAEGQVPSEPEAGPKSKRRWKFAPDPAENPPERSRDRVPTGAGAGFHGSRPGSRRGGY